VNDRDLNVIFDLGGVLVEWNPARILADRYPERAHRELIEQEVFRHQDWLDLDRGTLDEATAIERFHRRTGFAHDDLSQLMDAARDSLLLKHDTWALLHELRTDRVPLYCLSNMAVSTFRYLQARYDVWGAFNGIVISGEIGMVKPEPDIFEYLLTKYEIDRSRCVFIDDLLVNVETARQLGLHGIHFRDAEDCRAQLDVIS
jgi:putative hydrolase of the HAD superfamily